MPIKEEITERMQRAKEMQHFLFVPTLKKTESTSVKNVLLFSPNVTFVNEKGRKSQVNKQLLSASISMCTHTNTHIPQC
jgi:hypothetical protein